MRKTISILLICAVLASLLAGCKSDELSDRLNGSDLAKLLLAGERLDAQIINSHDSIFENGVEVMNNLANTAIANLNASYAGNKTHTVATLSSAKNLSTVLEGDYSGKVEIGEDTFTWSGFEENNNSYDYFKNITDGIVSSAEVCAELIDNIKSNVRVIDKWVAVGDIQYYLSVDENSETLCERSLPDNRLVVCKRYKNAEGDDVYELYLANDKYQERCTYIPGKRYERSVINDYGEHAEDYFVADNGKGYWETYIVGAFSTHYNVSYFIMKDDICYDALYNPKDGSISVLKVMSADRATDIFNFSDYGASVKFGGFNGIKSVEAPADSVTYVKDDLDDFAYISSYDGVKVYLTNGRVLNIEDSFVDGNVRIMAVPVSFSGLFGYIGELELNIQGETVAERIGYLQAFLNEVGLECRRNIDGVFAGIYRAYAELDSIIRYYTWNGISVVDEAGIGEAIRKEMVRFDEMEALYTAVQDAEVLDISDTEGITMNIKFAPITQSEFKGATLNAGEVTVDSISLTIEDTTLYVEGAYYKVMLALANADDALVHVDMENSSSIQYAQGDSFTVTASQVHFTLPELSSGKYTPVAYIATSDGIRVSAYTSVPVSEIADMPISIQNMTVSAVKNENETLTLNYVQEENFTVTLTTQTRVGYEEFKTLVSQTAFEYGVPSDTIEVLSGDTYIALTGEETEIADGTYRISYETENGDQVTQGYICVQYSCE